MDEIYETVRKIGRGGRSEVYLVKNKNTGALMAMKVYRNAEREAERETEILKLLGGRGAPFLIDQVRKEGETCVVMEYLDGMTLREYLREHPVTGWEKALDIAGEILKALIPMHMNEPPYVYGDLKPENIMITRSGKVVLFDFGSVIRTDEKDRPVFGTEGYMPKEDEEIGCERDIYAVGIILYELMTGNTLSKAVKNGSADVSHFPVFVTHIMQKAVHIRKEERYKNASEMYAALKGEDKEKRRDIFMKRKLKEKGNVYVAEVKRVALGSFVKGLAIFMMIYFFMFLFNNTLEAKAGTFADQTEISKEYYRYDKESDTYYDEYGRKLLFYDESLRNKN